MPPARGQCPDVDHPTHECLPMLFPFTSETVDIDVGIAGVMRALWSSGVPTVFSCQGFYNIGGAPAYIVFPTRADLHRGLEVLGFDPGTIPDDTRVQSVEFRFHRYYGGGRSRVRRGCYLLAWPWIARSDRRTHLVCHAGRWFRMPDGYLLNPLRGASIVRFTRQDFARACAAAAGR